MKVSDVLVTRGLITIAHDASMAEAAKVLKDARIRHLPVTRDNTIVGIISDRDIQRASTLVTGGNGSTIQEYKKVYEYMTSPVNKMNTNDSVAHLTREMIRMKISSFIIEDEKGTPVGIITTEDLLLLLLDKIDDKPNPFRKLFGR